MNSLLGTQIVSTSNMFDLIPFLERRTLLERIKELPKNPFPNYRYRYLETPRVVMVNGVVYAHPKIYNKIKVSLATGKTKELKQALAQKGLI